MKAKPSSRNCHQACGASTGQGCAQRTAEGGRRALTRAERRGTSLTPVPVVRLQTYLRTLRWSVAPGDHGNPRARRPAERVHVAVCDERRPGSTVQRRTQLGCNESSMRARCSASLKGDSTAATGACLGDQTLHAAAISCIASSHWRMALQAGWSLEFAIEGVFHLSSSI